MTPIHTLARRGILLASLLGLAGCVGGVFGEPPSCEDVCDVNASCAIGGDATTCACDQGYQGDGYTCADIDECAAGDPCGSGTCSNVDGWYACDCPDGERFDGVTCSSTAIFITGQGSQADPRRWEDGELASSCLEYIQPTAPYAYQGSTGDGWYALALEGQPRSMYCDMSTDGGGFTRVLHWDREGDPDQYTLASLGFQVIDEIAQAGDPDVSPMGDIVEMPDHVRWSDFDNTYDALAYRLDLAVPNSGELRFDVHYEAVSMEASGTWFYAVAAGEPQNLACWSTAENNANYTVAEKALIPYSCPDTDAAVPTFTWDNAGALEARQLDAEITSFHLRSLHADVDLGDSSHLYRVSLYVR